MEYLLQRALELGLGRPRIIDTETVVLADWVRWKCQYGCPLSRKTPSILLGLRMRPAPKRSSGEYSRAILLNGPNGQALTEAAVRLEGEAYQRGYSEAFALTALAPGGGIASAPLGPVPPRKPPDPAGRPRLRRSLRRRRKSKRWIQAPAAADPPEQTEAPAEPAKTAEVQAMDPSPGGC